MNNLTVNLESSCGVDGHIDEWPVIVLLLSVLVVGVTGNGLVFVTSALRPKRSSSSQFIVHLAIYDAMACLTVLPVALVGLLQKDLIQHNKVCKAYMFLCLLFALSALGTLDLVAVDRFLKICRPFSYGISYESSRRLFVLEFIPGVVFALATLFLQGVRPVHGQSPSAYCYRAICLLNNDFYQSEYRLVFNIMIFLVCGAMFAVLIVSYILVITALLRRRKRYRKPIPSIVISESEGGAERNIALRHCGDSDRPEVSVSDDTRRKSISDSIQTTSLAGLCPDDFNDESVSSAEEQNLYRESKGVSSERSAKPRIKTLWLKISSSADKPHRKSSPSKSTKILCVVTFTFIVCWLPTWVLSIFVRFHIRSVESLLDMTQEHRRAITFFEYWFLTSHAINPVIYAFMDPTFRRECSHLLLRLKPNHAG